MEKKKSLSYAVIVILLVAFMVLMFYRIRIVGMKPAVSEDKKRELRVKMPDPPVIGRSGDDLQIAWAELTEDGKLMVMVDGETDSLKYDEVSFIEVSPKGERVAYSVRKGSDWYMVLDGKAGLPYDEISIGCITFSPNGERFAYGARKGDKWFVVLDGKVVPEEGHDFVSYFTFSPDSKRFVYTAGKDNRQLVVLDGKAGPFYFLTGKPVFSPDGKGLAYVALFSLDVKCVVLDGKEGKKYNGEINIPIFSSDSKHIAYSVREENSRFVVLDGEEGPEYEINSTIYQVKFAPDDNRLAYLVAKDREWVAVIDGKEGPPYDGIGGSGSSIKLGSGRKSFAYEGIEEIESGIALSPDGKSFAYAAYEEGKWFVVLNGEEGRKYDGIASGTPVFGPYGKNLFYGARIGNKWFTVIDGEEGTEEYDGIGRVVRFSSDGKHIVYSAKIEDRWVVVLDGKAGKEYDYVFKPVFTNSGIEYLAERDSDGWLLRCRQPYPGSNAAPESYKDGIKEIKITALP